MDAKHSPRMLKAHAPPAGLFKSVAGTLDDRIALAPFELAGLAHSPATVSAPASGVKGEVSNCRSSATADRIAFLSLVVRPWTSGAPTSDPSSQRRANSRAGSGNRSM